LLLFIVASYANRYRLILFFFKVHQPGCEPRPGHGQGNGHRLSSSSRRYEQEMSVFEQAQAQSVGIGWEDWKGLMRS
jgi:hypothetical protein